MKLFSRSVGSGPDLVLLHGWSMHSGTWQALIPTLAERYRVHCIDLPGHGQSHFDGAGDFALDSLVDALATQVPQATAVIGWSLGGMLALRWAERYPTQIRQLCLIASTPCYVNRSDWAHGTPPDLLAQFSAQVAADPARTLQRFADLQSEGETEQRSVRKGLRALLTATALPTAAALTAGLDFLAQVDLRDSVPRLLQQTTLLIHGAGDTITPPAASQWLAAHLPRAELNLIPGCGHAPQQSHPAEVLALLHLFLHE